MTKRVKMVRGSGSVFRDLGFSEPQARSLALRSEVMIRIEEFVERSGMTQARRPHASVHPAAPSTTC